MRAARELDRFSLAAAVVPASWAIAVGGGDHWTTSYSGRADFGILPHLTVGEQRENMRQGIDRMSIRCKLSNILSKGKRGEIPGRKAEGPHLNFRKGGRVA